ncbi:aldehyde dehydrogenase family protein [Subtercola sp. YIM 133946]|uniref:aldehyde dehydrogenase family protein n=1 Tax=Subtercola sp. YIM 133946 TaxID=3118909 RepID=UPI002F9287A6
MITTTNPATGVVADTSMAPTDPADVDAIARAAGDASLDLQARGREWRATLLDAMAAAAERHRAELVGTAAAETGLTEARLNGELSRSAFQFSLFAEAVREGSMFEAMIDHAADTPLGAAPDVRRLLVSVGAVAVFGSSNFPFAFSVLGGDVASAIAAGSAVVAKAHGSHPETSRLSFEVLREAAAEVGAPAATFGIVYGQAAGVTLVQHPSIAAVGFTGSLGAASALRAAIDTRPDPIPFYGELSSVNPLIVTPGAVAARSDEIAAGLFAAVTGSAGQLCTKPGIAFIPDGAEGQLLVDALARLTEQAEAQVLLNSRIRDSYHDITARLKDAGGDVLATGAPGGLGDAFDVSPTILSTLAAELTSELSEECFGPLVVLARYSDLDTVASAFLEVPRSLTATVHAEDDELAALAPLVELLQRNVGRVVFNGYPTGVRVSWAQQHGGPWPATNSLHTSVGVTAMRRFLRPIAWQNAPQSLLPAELRDGPLTVPTRVDGVLRLP